MTFQRITTRLLPSGEISTVFPFHICMEGVENSIICTDEQDYDLMVKYTALAAKRSNIIIVVYVVISNHIHLVILARSREDSYSFCNELKRIWSMWTKRKYSRRKSLLECDISSIYLSTDWYLRNAMAYTLRNALDNGAEINSYEWSSYGAYFNDKENNKSNNSYSSPVHSETKTSQNDQLNLAKLSTCTKVSTLTKESTLTKLPTLTRVSTHTKVSTLTKREREEIFHTHQDLRGVPWLLDRNNHLIPSSFCDQKYLEDAFNNNQALFLKTIGSVNTSEMQQKLVDSPRTFQYDSEFYKIVNDIATSWFNTPVSNLSIEKKARLLPYLYHSYKTSVAQLARIIELPREDIARILHIKYTPSKKE